MDILTLRPKSIPDILDTKGRMSNFSDIRKSGLQLKEVQSRVVLGREGAAESLQITILSYPSPPPLHFSPSRHTLDKIVVGGFCVFSYWSPVIEQRSWTQWREVLVKVITPQPQIELNPFSMNSHLLGLNKTFRRAFPPFVLPYRH